MRTRKTSPSTVAPGPPVLYTDALGAQEARDKGCRTIEGTPITIVQAPPKPRYLPGPAVTDDDAALAQAAGDIGTTIFHPVGTAKMGLASDHTAVVDARLRVIGLQGLRVIDASVMPTITSGNTNTPTIMIAEQGARFVLADARTG